MPLSWRNIHLRAVREAARAHRDLHIDTSRAVEPFAALDASGVVVFRRRLDGIAGLYLPGDSAASVPGVLINAAHPITKQRFTAAHELWHHRRDRTAVIDSETEWFARGGGQASDRERLAEAFAAWFLMPRRLIEARMTARGLSGDRLDAHEIYGLALDMGTSYMATVHHLGDLGVLDLGRRDNLARIAPQRIKRELGGQDAIADAWKDVRLVRVRDGERMAEVHAEQGDAVILEVPETPSSGYVWATSAVPPELVLLWDEYMTPDERAIGATSRHRFLFRVDAAVRGLLQIELRRPWEVRPPAESVQVHITADPAPTSGLVRPSLLSSAA